jgi:hypothetical protein
MTHIESMCVPKSRFSGVSWHVKRRRWQVVLRVSGSLVFVQDFRHEDEALAAEVADEARWFLQDFLGRAPSYNFPQMLPLQDMGPRVRAIRTMFLQNGFPRHRGYDSRFTEPLLPQNVTQFPKNI